ncbi:Holliday junction endonuclease RuvC [Agreia bicolorata]|uniref:Crossover junction endodeoxyribonuclease RuvC n=1 Tax=Agreia bicolorata TaxID=110935 RepID=A0A1T4X657_9MICO|nr:crossover junction endodeoxyribonuclease RuvC [Agreia bicolorata]SKA85160.1 Holliday junction endonuclease RuvC [Agreia bicolorata]
MRVLGIDPGLTRCGVGVVDVTANRVATLVAVTVVRTPPTMELDQRLLGIALGLDELIDEHRPESIAIERVFAQHNVSTVMGTAQVSGIALLAAARHGIPVSLHTPTEVKASITGYGQAEKKQVGTMVAKILGLSEIPKPADAADALALAICHAWRSPATSSARASGDSASEPGMTRAQQAWRAAEKAAGTARRLTR